MQIVFTLTFITVAPTSSIQRQPDYFPWAYDSHRVQKKLCQSEKNTLGPSDFESRTNILVLRINVSIPAFFPLGTHCTWRLDELTNVCLIYRVLKHYKQYPRTYQHENLASVDFKGILGTLLCTRHLALRGFQSCRTQEAGSLPLRCSQEWYKQEEHQIQK